MGFRAYVHTARMLRAMALLGEESGRVAEVARAVGFASQGAFSTAFRDFAGESPSRHRRRVLGG